MPTTLTSHKSTSNDPQKGKLFGKRRLLLLTLFGAFFGLILTIR
jgi:hypothetical protein